MVRALEMGDVLAHQLVSVLLLLLAIGILIVSSFNFIVDIRHTEIKDFAPLALEYLSELLLGVIVLELLSTLLAYIKSRSLEATIKDFLIVAIISSVRKILLVGAYSSIVQGSGDEFVKEAIGTILTIVGILLLVCGLLLLQGWRGRKLL